MRHHSGPAADWLERALGRAFGGPPFGPPPPELWPSIAGLAEAQHLGGRLRAAMRDSALPWPADLAAGWRAQKYRDQAGALLRRQELGAALDGLAAAGVPVILLKGAALCATVFGDWSLRPMGDLDLLVPEASLAAALGALAGLGYALVLGHDELVERGETPDLEALRTFHAQVTLRRDAAPPGLIDLHWHLLDRPSYRHRMDMRPIWEAALPVRVDGRPALVLSPEDMVLHLAAHPLVHHPEAPPDVLSWRLDLGAFLRAHPGIDWPELLRRAGAFRLAWALREALPRVPAWAGVPGDVLEALARMTGDPAEPGARRWATRVRPGPGLQLLDQLLHLPRWSLRLAYLRAKLIPSPAYLRRRHERAGARGMELAALYLRRWGRGIRRLVGRPPR